MFFTGTVYTDGSTTINNSFPEARRSGYATVIIGEQLRDSDTDITIRDDTYRPEAQSEVDNLDQEINTSNDEQDPASVTITHSARNWRVVIPQSHRNSIGEIHVRDKGVNTTWRILAIRGEDVLSRCTKEVIDKHKKEAAKQDDQVTTVPISPQQCKREWAAKRKCKCPNTDNQWHKCTQWCKDNYNFNGECRKKKYNKKIKEQPPVVIQILDGPLSGCPQTTPRAELEAIASTLENALPPILIVTDHLNHVEAYYRGKHHCLKVTSPLIDIWIRIWKQIHRLGKGNVTLKWIPSHQSANSNKTWEQKIDRRANEIADIWPAEGRKVHDLPKQLTVALKKAETTTMEYHKWTAYAAYSQHNGPIEPDHDIRKGPRPPRKKRAKRNAVTNDQAILNRRPFANRSLGISQWQGPQMDPNRAPQRRCNNATRLYNLCQRRNINRAGVDQSLALASTADAPLDTVNIDNRRRWDADDHDDLVPPEHTANHTIWVAGNANQPWIWCNK